MASSSKAGGAASGATTGAMAGAAFGPIGAGAGALLGGLAGGLLAGGEQRLNQSTLGMMRGGVQAGGLRSDLFDENRTVAISSDPQRRALVEQLSKTFGGAAGQLGVLRGQLKPGFGALTQARRQQLEMAERGALGDLRSNLSRRRVLGSSFASDQEAAVRDRFGRAKSEADAQSFMEELEASVQLLQAETATRAQAFSTKLNEANLQVGLAQGILASSSDALGRLASVNAAAQADWANNVFSLGTGIGALVGMGGGTLLGGGEKET